MDPYTFGGGDFHRDPAAAINASTACYIGASDICIALGDEQSLDAIAGADDADSITYYCAVLDAHAGGDGNPRRGGTGHGPSQEQPVNRIIVAPITGIMPHPTAAHLRIGKVGDHQVVVGDHYYEGQLGFFLPDGVIVPDRLAEEMWVRGRLAGKGKNRVKARLMQGVASDGLFYGSQGASWNPDWSEGTDITDEIGVGP